ncbi:hypothetical protein B0J13DRAFT_534823 [Dactylonectria estremocensis]|uniref:PcRGLX/YetA-like central beta-sandwich domain-containing protein n=1 Tax=Dactylonectria estremocensis TaxID=1079267 RepID=A0A9P9CY81_9HYPO|nr:hypothetical protein B0J13DRAFT_534823 [Dactylonectria estremocensis]
MGDWLLARWIYWSAYFVLATEAVPSSYSINVLGTSVENSTTVRSETNNSSRKARRATPMAIKSRNEITVDTGKIRVSFPKSGSTLVSSIQISEGKTVCTNGKLILRCQSAIVDYEDDNVAETPIKHHELSGHINQTTITEESLTRALVTVTGKHEVENQKNRDSIVIPGPDY